MMEAEARLLERSWTGKDNKEKREVLLEKLLLILLEQTVEHSSKLLFH